MNQFFDQEISGESSKGANTKTAPRSTQSNSETDLAPGEQLAEVKPLRPHQNNHIEDLMMRVRDLIDTARAMPMSASVLVNREELLELIDDSVALLPEELKRARWLLKEKEQFLTDAKREAKEITDQAANTASRMVEEREIVRQAESAAQKIIVSAENNARALQHESEDYVDTQLKAFEETLTQTLNSVIKGREKLQVQEEAEEVHLETDDSSFYDFDEE